MPDHHGFDAGNAQPGLDLSTLAKLPRWVAWQTIERGVSRRPTKVPFTANRKPAKSDDPRTWGTRTEAEAWAKLLPMPMGAGGVGIMFGDHDGLAIGGIDLDTCRDGEAIASWAEEVIARFGSYAEVSPSGTGAKVLFTIDAAVLAKVRKRLDEKSGRLWKQNTGTDHPPAIELYLGGRFFAVTDQGLATAPAEVRQAEADDLAWLIDTAGPAFSGEGKAKKSRAKGGKAKGGSGDGSRSARAFKVAAEVKRAGGGYDDFKAKLAAEPDTAAWLEEKGLPVGERECRRTWENAGQAVEEEAWRDDLILTEGGAIAACAANVETVLLNHPRWRDVLWFDDFAVRAMIRRPPPWEPDTSPDQWRERPLVDADLIRTAIWMQRNGVMIAEQRIKGPVEIASRARAEHPLRAYLDGLRWDSKPRLDKWLTYYVGAAATPYHAAVGARWMIGAVARAYRPGCKLDTALVLEGPQNQGKSSVAQTLAGEAYFTDHLPDLGSKDALIQIQGKWIVEMAELAGMNRAESDRIKGFMSTQCDRFRGPWGVIAQDYPRQCAFMGTVNPENGYLKDPTGGRRFWSVRCGDTIDLDALRRDRDQLWAEAVSRFRSGEPWWLDTDDLQAAAREEQADRYTGDAKDARISAWVEFRPSVTIGEVLEGALGFTDPAKWTQAEQNTVARCLVSMGWQRRQVRIGARREWRYLPPNLDARGVGSGDKG